MRLPYLLIAFSGFVFNGCQDTTAEATTPPPAEITDDYLTLSSGPLTIALDPKVGGRIASFTYDGKEILKTSRDSSNLQWGSTFWTSPQSDWDWPPVATFDVNPYTVAAQQENRIILISDLDRESNLQITKSVRLAEDETWGHVATVRYQIYNRGDDPVKVAPWENTRVPFDGQITYPAGGSEERFNNSDAPAKIQATDSLKTIELDGSQPNKQKIYYDPTEPAGKYLSHTYVNNGLVLTKSWKRPRTVAPEQSRLEFYLAPEAGFAELEVQGEYREIGPGARVEMLVFWQLREVGE